MTHIELLRSKGACSEGIEYASQHPSLDAAIKACTYYGWLVWAVDNMLDERTRVAVRCNIVRHTPLADGRTVWDLLTDERSRRRIEIEEAWARGEDISDEDRAAAGAAAGDAVWDAAWAAPRAAAGAAAGDAVWAAAWDAARAWQMDYIRSLDWTQVEGGEG